VTKRRRGKSRRKPSGTKRSPARPDPHEQGAPLTDGGGALACLQVRHDQRVDIELTENQSVRTLKIALTGNVLVGDIRSKIDGLDSSWRLTGASIDEGESQTLVLTFMHD
jgi:hypothetical protein